MTTQERERAGRAWTPGPLTYDRYTGDIVMDDELGARVAMIDLDNCANKDQAHADGRLFAAAPELVEALQRIRSLSKPGQSINISQSIDILCDIWNAAEAALSLAMETDHG